MSRRSRIGSNTPIVITGLDPVIQDHLWVKRSLDCRIKSGNDNVGALSADLLF